MTWTAWRQGALNALICAIGLLVVCLAVASALSLVVHRGLGELFRIAFAGFGALAFLPFWERGSMNCVPKAASFSIAGRTR
jgi:hypothetical protein